jgi:hypothetical protein
MSECKNLIDFVETQKLLAPSKVLNVDQSVDQQVRVSETAWIPKTNPIAPAGIQTVPMADGSGRSPGMG